MQALEQRAFAEGVSAEALMEEAGEKIAAAVRQFFPLPGRCLVFFGKGHNGGDALVAARHLAAAGWRIEPRPVFEAAHWSVLTKKKFAALGTTGSGGGPAVVVLDGLLGIGAGGPLREPIRGAASAINALRLDENASVFAIDLPTGLDGDLGNPGPDCVRADFTLTIGFAKRGLVSDAATPFVGRLAILPLEELTRRAFPEEDTDTVATARLLAPLLPPRPFDVHKGDFGRIAIVAGSRGLTGAALMASKACVRAGAGLVSLYVTEEIHPIVAVAASPEVMVRSCASYFELLETKPDVIAIGPGLGFGRRAEVLELIRLARQPMIIDADAITLLAAQPGALDQCAGPRLLTPHPGEMARLDPGSKERSRAGT
ncbi:MAG: NAD(P)H-hydrate epimerase, partial [Verrucomicrobiota bacterium]